MTAKGMYRAHRAIDVILISANFVNFVLNQFRASQAKGNAFIGAELIALVALAGCCFLVNMARKTWPRMKALVDVERQIGHWTGRVPVPDQRIRIPWLNR